MFPNVIIALVKEQIRNDLINCNNGKSVSLLAKWMPSINTSSRNKVQLANRLAVGMGYSPGTYRKNLSKLRKYIDVVEVKMSHRDWDKINYETVPSKANLLYKNAFNRHDPERRAEFLEKLSRGEAKINASTSYPYEIYHNLKKLIKYGNFSMDNSEIMTLESMWKSILDGVSISKRIIVVADGSGSMEQTISNSTEATAYDVANSLALYFAQSLVGEFHGKFITFSEHPMLIDVGQYSTLTDQMQETFRHREVANTNIEAVFDLILQTAVENKMTAEELPECVLIISDMEFDNCAEDNSGNMMKYQIGGKKTLFDHIAEKYNHYGYQLPRLVFWNVCSRTMTIPVRENALGVALVSGFSVNNINMVLSGDMDPYLCLVHALQDKRYDPVSEAAGFNTNN